MKSNKTKLFDGRTLEQIRKQYELEKSFAEKLKHSNISQRKAIFETMYDEIFEQVPDHPRLRSQKSPQLVALINENKFKLIKGFVDKTTILAEFGPGDCRFAIYASDYVKQVYAMDISDQSGKLDNMPDNLELITYDGYDVEGKECFADVAFSDQLIEHLHPDDVKCHFELVRKMLKPKGVYIFRTPHKYTGPHDISRYFSDEAEGLHLHEWTYTEMANMLKGLKYSSWYGCWYAKGICVKLPFAYFFIIEHILKNFPKWLKRIASKFFLPNVTMVLYR